MNLQEYIKNYYDNDFDWFVSETSQLFNRSRIDEVLTMRSYIDGNHKIRNQKFEIYNGVEYKPKSIVVDMISLVIEFHVNYLLRNEPTISSSSEEVTRIIRGIYEKGYYDDVDIRLLKDLICYGNSYEYIYTVDNTIKSKVIAPEDAYPIYSPVTSEMIGFIEHFNVDGISYFNVFDGTIVKQYTDNGGNLRQIGEYVSLSGLPIHYKSENELDHCFGKSELIRLMPLLDDYESILSKFSDTFYKHHNPILFQYGSRTDQYKMFPSIVGQGVSMDLDSNAEFLAPKLDVQSFKELTNKLFIDFITLAGIPSVAINNSEISNVSTTAIQMMYESAETKAGNHEKQLKRGFRQRWQKIRKLLELQGVTLDDEGFNKLDVKFRTAKPFNMQEQVEVMKTLKEIGGISTETIIENSYFTTDKELERKRLQSEGQVS